MLSSERCLDNMWRSNPLESPHDMLLDHYSLPTAQRISPFGSNLEDFGVFEDMWRSNPLHRGEQSANTLPNMLRMDRGNPEGVDGDVEGGEGGSAGGMVPLDDLYSSLLEGGMAENGGSHPTLESPIYVQLDQRVQPMAQRISLSGSDCDDFEDYSPEDLEYMLSVLPQQTGN